MVALQGHLSDTCREVLGYLETPERTGQVKTGGRELAVGEKQTKSSKRERQRYRKESVVNGKCETLRDSEKGVFLC